MEICFDVNKSGDTVGHGAQLCGLNNECRRRGREQVEKACLFQEISW